MKLVTTKLGGQLEPFADVSKGYRLAKPLGWNRYDGTSGEYTVKMVDLVDPTTLILLTNSPVKSDTEVGAMKRKELDLSGCVHMYLKTWGSRDNSQTPLQGGKQPWWDNYSCLMKLADGANPALPCWYFRLSLAQRTRAKPPGRQQLKGNTNHG